MIIIVKQLDAGDGGRIRGGVPIDFNDNIGAWCILFQLPEASRLGTSRVLTGRALCVPMLVFGNRGRKLSKLSTVRTSFFLDIPLSCGMTVVFEFLTDRDSSESCNAKASTLSLILR